MNVVLWHVNKILFEAVVMLPLQNRLDTKGFKNIIKYLKFIVK